MKPVVVFQSVNKFGMFTFVVSYTVCFNVFFSLTSGENEIFGFLVGERKGGTNHPSIKLCYICKEILIKKVFHLTLKENLQKTKEVLRKLQRLSLPL